MASALIQALPGGRRRCVGDYMNNRWIVALLLSAAPSGVAAQQQQNVDALRDTDIVVTATGQTQATSGTKTATRLIEVPQAISVITREELDVRAVHSVTEALAYTAGVQAEQDGIDSRADGFSVRGFSAGSFSDNLFVDGIRLPAGGQWTRTAFDPFALQQIEVLKGPSAVLFGQVAPGGIVNLVTKRPTKAPRGEVMVQGAGFTDLGKWQYQGAADVSGALTSDGTVSARLVGLARYGDAQIDTIKTGRYYIAPSLTWAPDAATSLTLMTQYQRDEGGSTFQFLPDVGARRPGAGGRHIRLDGFLGEPQFNTYDRNQYMLGYELRHAISDRLEITQNGRYTRVETLFEGTILRGGTLANGQTVNRRAVRGVGHSDGYGLDTKVEGRVDTGMLAHRVLVGVDMLDTEWRHLRDFTADVLPMPDIFDPSPQGLGRLLQTLAPQVHENARLEQVGVYGQDQVAIGALHLTLGARYDWATNHQIDELATGAADPLTLTKADKLTWRAGATWVSDNGIAPYASYSTSFQPTTGQYFDGTPFKPTTGEQYEAGVKFQPRDSNALLTAAVYQLTQNNLESPDPDPTHVCAGFQCSVQTGQGRIRGVELEGKATLVGGLSMIATGTYMDGEITRGQAGEQGKRLAQVPGWMGSAFADYRFAAGGALAGVGLGGGVRYVGVSYGDTANAYRVPDYTLFDLFLRKSFANGIILSVNARNLANQRYVATCSSPASCFYGSGRTLNLRLQYRW